MQIVSTAPTYRPTCGNASVNGSAPSTENQITILRPKRSPIGPPKNAPTAFAARKMKR